MLISLLNLNRFAVTGLIIIILYYAQRFQDATRTQEARLPSLPQGKADDGLSSQRAHREETRLRKKEEAEKCEP